MLLLNKVFEEQDFRWLPAINDIDEIRSMIKKAGFSPGWDNSKAWEVSMVCEAIRRCYGDKSKLEILDIGGGQGILPILLNKKGHSVTCIDPEPIELFMTWAKALGIRYNKGTIFALPYANYSFDIISSICVLEHICSFPGEPERWQEIVGPTVDALIEIARVLRPGGCTVHTVDYHFPELGMQYAAYSKRVLLEIFKQLESVFEVSGDINYDIDASVYFLRNERLFEEGKQLSEELEQLKQGQLPDFAVTKASFVLRKI
jgi:ubiquinone/menaquinone biosynthesis C-methylase UbiE